MLNISAAVCCTKTINSLHNVALIINVCCWCQTSSLRASVLVLCAVNLWVKCNVTLGGCQMLWTVRGREWDMLYLFLFLSDALNVHICSQPLVCHPDNPSMPLNCRALARHQSCKWAHAKRPECRSSPKWHSENGLSGRLSDWLRLDWLYCTALCRPIDGCTTSPLGMWRNNNNIFSRMLFVKLWGVCFNNVSIMGVASNSR